MTVPITAHPGPVPAPLVPVINDTFYPFIQIFRVVECLWGKLVPVNSSSSWLYNAYERFFSSTASFFLSLEVKKNAACHISEKPQSKKLSVLKICPVAENFNCSFTPKSTDADRSCLTSILDKHLLTESYTTAMFIHFSLLTSIISVLNLFTVEFKLNSVQFSWQKDAVRFLLQPQTVPPWESFVFTGH